MRTLIKSTLLTTAVRLYGFAAGIGILAISAHWLGPEALGRVATIASTVALFAVVFHLSLGQIVIHQAAERRSATWLQDAVSGIAVVTAVMTLAGWLIAVIWYESGATRTFRDVGWLPLAIGFVGLPALVWEQNSSYLLMAAARVRVFNGAQTLVPSINVLALIAFTWGLGLRIEGVLMAALLAQLCGATITFTSLARTARRLSLSTPASLKKLLSDGLQLHVNAVATFAVSGIDILIVQWFRGNEETGYYSVAVQLVSALFILPDSASLLLYSMTAQLGSDRAWPQTKGMLAVLLGLMTILVVSVAAFAPTLLVLFAGAQFQAAAPVLRILLLSFVGRTVSAVLGPQWIGRGLFWQASALTVTAGVLNVTTAVILVPRMGMAGAAWAFVVTYGVGIVVSGIFGLWVERRVRAA